MLIYFKQKSPHGSKISGFSSNPRDSACLRNLASPDLDRWAMKMRPSTTTSERQLCLALAATGRVVSLDELANWRKENLLPPLATSGLGAGRGRTYYWRDDNILVRAEVVWDCMRRHGRRDQTLMTLFLSGFSVPLQTVRRMWLHRARLRKALHMRSVAPGTSSAIPNGMQGPENFLMLALSCIGEALDAGAQGRNVIAAIERGLERSSFFHPNDNSGIARQLWYFVMIVTPALEAGNLFQECGDEEVCEAQRYAGMAIAFLKRGCPREMQDDVIETAGPLSFTIALALLRAGHRAMLDDVFARLQYIQPGLSLRPSELIPASA